MAIVGRKPKPTALHRLNGNPSKIRLDKEEPQPIGPLVKPDGLDDVASAEWDRAVSAMPPGLYTSADAPALVVHCNAWSLYQTAAAEVAREGITSFGSHGNPMQHPAVRTMTTQAEALGRSFERLGMSPSARSRLVMPKSGEQGKFGALLGGKPLRLVTPPAPTGS